MFRYTFKRLGRAPVPALGVLLFAVVLSIVLCTLERSNQEEQRKFDETFDAIPVIFTVTNLSGTKYLDLGIPGYFIYPFQQLGCLEPYVSDLQIVADRYTLDGTRMMGITSLALSPELSAEKGTTVTWKEGYDEGIFATEEFLALVPEWMETCTDEATGEEFVELYFRESRTVNGVQEYLKYTCHLTVAGTYAGNSCNTAVYCPYAVCIRVCYKLVKGIELQAVRATLADNHDLEALREAMWEWFAEPNALGQKTAWENGQYGYDYYPYALDIDDTLLQKLTTTLQTSITVNRVCRVLVLCLSAGAGMLIGFLMVRSRKREIGLLRTMGTPTVSIYVGFALEQLVCFGLGIALGGAYNRWQPAQQLWILTGVFFAGLTAALLIFLRKNLITTIKEED